MSPPKKAGRRFGYLSGDYGEDSGEKAAIRFGEKERAAEQETDAPGRIAGEEAGRDGGGGEGRRRARRQREPSTGSAPAQELRSVPKGQGRMKQARSQLNVRLPTTLKRQATAKAILEGRDIGEVIEDLLQEYLQR